MSARAAIPNGAIGYTGLGLRWRDTLAEAMPSNIIVLWVYIVLLLAGGLMGFIKAGSKISLIVSSVFAAALALCATGIIHPFYVADILVGCLLLVFGMRFAKGKKFMPSGLMLILSAGTLAALLFLK